MSNLSSDALRAIAVIRDGEHMAPYSSLDAMRYGLVRYSWFCEAMEDGGRVLDELRASGHAAFWDCGDHFAVSLTQKGSDLADERLYEDA